MVEEVSKDYVGVRNVALCGLSNLSIMNSVNKAYNEWCCVEDG